MVKPKVMKPADEAASHKDAWRMNLSVAHRGPKPGGRTTVQKAPKLPSWKVRFK